jgi:hypothetical protein
MESIASSLRRAPVRLMTLLRLPVLAAMLLLLANSPGFAANPTPPSLAKPPLGERWFGIYFNGERTGFVRSAISEVPGGYRMESESSVKMSGFGFSREATVRETYLVNSDLTLRSFEVSQTIDGSPMKLLGETREKSIRITIESAGNRTEKVLAKKGAVYPPPAVNIVPLMKGASAGKMFRLSMLDVEALKIKNVQTTVIGGEKLDGAPALHLRNDLYPFVSNDIWVDPSGNTLKESVRDGWIETRAETEDDARKFLAEAALCGKDMILDFSLVTVDRPIERASAVKRMELELSGVPENFPLLPGPFQRVERRENGIVIYSVATVAGDWKATPENGKDFLSATERILADNPKIMKRQQEILGDISQARARVEKLAAWVAGNVENSITDSQSPIETLEKRAGNCQSHARLYASLARAAGIPTRFVSGLVFADGKGFLYHSWAESLVDGLWLPVDPTFGEIPANATHIKLAEGDAPDDMAPMAAIIGRIKARILKLDY